MSPRSPDPAVRSALVEAAARLLVDQGPSALTTRRLTGEVGVSTMAVYTHFGSMEDVRRAVAVEGFERLSRALDAVPRTDDPVADVAAMGGAYLGYGIANPDLYRFVFREQPEEPEIGAAAFGRLTAGIQRAVDAGRLTTDPAAIALQLWVTTHGITSLHLAGMLTLDDALGTLTGMGTSLFAGFGDEPDRTRASIARAAEFLESQSWERPSR